MGKTRMIYFAFNPARFNELVTFMLYQHAQFYGSYYVFSNRHYVVMPGIGIEVPKQYSDHVINLFQLKKVYVMRHADTAKLGSIAKHEGLLLVSNSLEKIRSAVHALILSQI